MAEIKLLATYTLINAVVAPVTVETHYAEVSAGDIYAVFINEANQFINGIATQQGHGFYVSNANAPLLTDLEVDTNGNLIVFGDNADKYSLNAEGHLIYTD